MTDSQYLDAIRERILRFQRLPGVHLPIYEEHAGIDCGRYLGLIRDTAEWGGKGMDDYPVTGSESRAAIAEHLVRSVQDLEGLLEIISRLEAENRRLTEQIRQ